VLVAGLTIQPLAPDSSGAFAWLPTSSQKIGDIKGESVDANTRTRSKCVVLVGRFEYRQRHHRWRRRCGQGHVPGSDDRAHIDKASPRLLEACATGLHIKDATITHRKAGKGQQEFLVVKMNDVIVTAVSHGGTASQPAGETVSLAFAKVDFEYRPKSRMARLTPASTSSTNSRRTKWGRRRAALEDAIAVAILLQTHEQLVEAGELYRRVLEMAPDHPRALHYAGVLAINKAGTMKRSRSSSEASRSRAGSSGLLQQPGHHPNRRDRLDRAIDAYRARASRVGEMQPSA